MKKFKGKKILVTAGPVWAPIDRIRVISNIFSGSLGLLIAKEAVKKGAKTTLLLGPGGCHLLKRTPENLRIIRFRFFSELFDIMKREISSRKYDIVIHSAAVSDYLPATFYPGKIRSGKKEILIRLKPAIKIIDRVKKWDPEVFLVKFKLEAGKNKKELLKKGKEAMEESKADLVVANDLKDICGNRHRAFILDKEGGVVACRTKQDIARSILSILSQVSNIVKNPRSEFRNNDQN